MSANPGKNALGALLFAALLPLATPLAHAETVARYNGQSVDALDVRTALDGLPPNLREAVQQKPQSARNFAADLLTRQVLAARAREEGLDADPQVAAQVRQAVNQILFDAWLDRHGKADPAVAEALVRGEYKANPERFVREEMVHVRHILIETADAPEDALLQAQVILARLQSGEDFAELAKEFSADKGSAERGGDLGFFPRGKMIQIFEDAAFALREPGQLSAPVLSQFGYHILRLEERRAAGRYTWEEVRDQQVAAATERLRLNKRRELVGALHQDPAFQIDDEALEAAIAPTRENP